MSFGLGIAVLGMAAFMVVMIIGLIPRSWARTPFKSPAFLAKCFDSDSSEKDMIKSYYAPGITKIKKKAYQDTCKDTNKLKEYYCFKEGVVAAQTVDCSHPAYGNGTCKQNESNVGYCSGTEEKPTEEIPPIPVTSQQQTSCPGIGAPTIPSWAEIKVALESGKNGSYGVSSDDPALIKSGVINEWNAGGEVQVKNLEDVSSIAFSFLASGLSFQPVFYYRLVDKQSGNVPVVAEGQVPMTADEANQNKYNTELTKSLLMDLFSKVTGVNPSGSQEPRLFVELCGVGENNQVATQKFIIDFYENFKGNYNTGEEQLILEAHTGRFFLSY